MFDKILKEQITSEKYFNKEDLRFNRKYGYLLSSKQYDDFLMFKETQECAQRKDLPLVSWNSNKMFYFNSYELLSSLKDYFLFYVNDIKANDSNYVLRNLEEVEIGILCSELDGTLKIEGVNTTRRQIEAIIKNKDNKDKNSKIIYNMYQGLLFLANVPEFNKENLKKLYDILSNDCLSEDYQIGDNYYRDDVVYIGGHTGCPQDKIDECMNSLFDFVNLAISKCDNSDYSQCLIPFIAHYYILYIHPYFDYNGRTARMVQIWIMLLMKTIPSIFLSEAINDNKNAYYDAIEASRNTNNDLSYFLIYLIKLSNSYYIVHKNLEFIKSNIEAAGETITQYELHYLKRIILNKNTKWFNYKAFIKFASTDLTKQGALKVLNHLEEKKILISRINSSKEKIFSLNDDIIQYEIY